MSAVSLASLTLGEDGTYKAVVTRTDGTPVDLRLAGTTLAFVVSRELNAAVLFEKTYTQGNIGDPIVVPGIDPGNVAYIPVKAEDTAGLATTTRLTFALHLTEQDGTRTTVAYGALPVVAVPAPV